MEKENTECQSYGKIKGILLIKSSDLKKGGKQGLSLKRKYGKYNRQVEYIDLR